MPAAQLWAASRADAAGLQEHADLEAAACEYVRRYPRHAPDFFQDHRQQRARLRAWGYGDAWAARLMMFVPDLAHFSLHAKDLGLEPSDEAPEGLFDTAVIGNWKKALRRYFTGPMHWSLEVGTNGRLHVHALAAFEDGPPQLRRPSSLVKPIVNEAHFENCVAYSYKPSMAYTAKNLALFWQVKRTLKRLPNTSGTLHLQTWVRPVSEQS